MKRVAGVGVVAIVAVLGACGHGADASSSDAATAASDGLDAAAFCGGRLGGSCAETVLGYIALCFQPSGACTVDTTSSDAGVALSCWANGYRLETAADGGAAIETWMSTSHTPCMTSVAGSGVYAVLFAHGSYDRVRGEVTCSDGTKVSVHADCPEIANAFVDAPDAGVSLGSCTPGRCP